MYVAMMVIGGVFLGVLIGQKYVRANFTAITIVAVVMSNTMYLAFLMVLLGYGLIEFTRELLSNSDTENHLLRVQQKAAAQYRSQLVSYYIHIYYIYNYRIYIFFVSIKLF